MSLNLDRAFIREALYKALEKTIDKNMMGINDCGFSPFGRLSSVGAEWPDGFYGLGKKVPSKNKILSFEIDYSEKHIIIFNKVSIEWIKEMEKLNFLQKGSKIVWWFCEPNYDIKEKVLALLGEFRTITITDDIKPRVSFYIEEKKKEFFIDFADE